MAIELKMALAILIGYYIFRVVERLSEYTTVYRNLAEEHEEYRTNISVVLLCLFLLFDALIWPYMDMKRLFRNRKQYYIVIRQYIVIFCLKIKTKYWLVRLNYLRKRR